MPAFDGGIRRISSPLGDTMALPTRGSQRVPPLAMAAYARASCSGVTMVSPWPIAKFTASPAR